jgi:hypothetical protein
MQQNSLARRENLEYKQCTNQVALQHIALYIYASCKLVDTARRRTQPKGTYSI